jgi:hypothetical protein
MKSTSYAIQNQITVIQPSKPESGEQVIYDYDYLNKNKNLLRNQ